MSEGITDRVLFVCVGNICRSPMAAGLLKSRLKGDAERFTVESAGISALVGSPADDLAMELMSKRQVDISSHRARQLRPELLADFDWILVMEGRHEKAVRDLLPSARGRVHRLGRFGNFDIPDPYGKPRAAFEASLRLIERGIDDYVRAFWTPK